MRAAVATLDEAYRSALGRDEGVRQGEQSVIRADERVSQLRGGLFPTISLNANHTIQQEPSDPVARQFSPQHQTTVNLSATQPLFRGLREFSGLSQARNLRQAQMATQEDTLSRLYQEVAKAYLGLLSLEQDRRNLESQTAIYEKRVKELGERARRGESSRSEVISAQAAFASLQAEMQLVDGQLDVARGNFEFLTGLPRDTRLSDPKLLSQGARSLRPLDDYLKHVEERPDVAAALKRSEAAHNAVSVAWGAHLPTIDAVGNYYFKRPGFLSDIKWDVGIKLTLPLFEGGITQSRIREAVAARTDADLELAKKRRAARQEIRSLHDRLEARVRHLERLKKSVELQEENSKVLQRDYRRGLTRNVDVQLALSELGTAKRAFDQAHFTAQIELCQLMAASALSPANRKGNSR